MDGPIDWWWKMNLLDVCVQAGFCQIQSQFCFNLPEALFYPARTWFQIKGDYPTSSLTFEFYSLFHITKL